MADKKMKMQAPKGTNAAVIEGHNYEVPKSGVITVAQASHVETLKRHGFIPAKDEPSDLADHINEMDDKDDLVEFIEERGGEADNSMGMKKLRRLAREAAGIEE